MELKNLELLLAKPPTADYHSLARANAVMVPWSNG